MTPIIENLSGDNRIVLRYHERFARQPLFINTLPWTKLRLGFRMCVESRATDLIQIQFRVGLCAGGSKIVGDGAYATCNVSHFAGLHVQGAFTTWNYNAGPPVRYTNTWTNGAVMVNSVTTASTGDLEASTMCTFCSNTSRSAYMLDITKGSPNWTFRAFRNTATGGADISKATFDAQMKAATPVIAGHSYQTAGAMAVNQATNGILDHVNVAWGHHTALILSDLTVVYLS